MPQVHFNKGQKRAIIKKYLEDTEISMAGLARGLNLTHFALRNWVHGYCGPNKSSWKAFLDFAERTNSFVLDRILADPPIGLTDPNPPHLTRNRKNRRYAKRGKYNKPLPALAKAEIVPFKAPTKKGKSSSTLAVLAIVKDETLSTEQKCQTIAYLLS